MDSLMKELRFFTLNKDLKKFQEGAADLQEKLDVIKELQAVIVSGEYKKMLQIEELNRKPIYFHILI